MPRLRLLEMSISTWRGGPNAESLKPLWAAPWFSQLQELSLTTGQGFGGRFGPLRAAPLLQKLTVAIGGPTMTAADGRALAAAALPALRELRLRHIERGLVAALAGAPWLDKLELLDLACDYGALDAADGRALAASPLPSLKRLHIFSVKPGFMAACAEAAWLGRLTCLQLRGKNEGEGGLLGGAGLPEGALALAATPFTALVSLTLFHDVIAPPSDVSRFAALVGAPWFGRLRNLTLRRWPLGSAGGSDGAGLRALAAAPLPNLTSLSLTRARLSAADVSGVLSHAPWLAALTSLKLACNHLHAPGHRALSRLHLPRLRALSLKRDGVDGAGLAALVSAPWLEQLTRLALEQVVSTRSGGDITEAIEDDAWVFGRMRRRGCDVDFRRTVHFDDQYRHYEARDDAGSDPSDC
jgi:hypothetical protein